MEEFDRLLAAGTGQLANASHSRVSPVGKAFAAAREAGINLYDYDLKHPGLAGAYLKACVTYLVISGKPFKGDVPSCGIDEETVSGVKELPVVIVGHEGDLRLADFLEPLGLSKRKERTGEE